MIDDDDFIPLHHVLDGPYQQCNRCGRKTWDREAFGGEDRLTQPDGNPCGGKFESP